jgi:death on curing protein
MRYVTAEEVARINVSLVGDGKLLDAGLLSSAVGRPQATFGGEDAYGTLSEKVAALFESVVLNHAFLDGNKRTAVVAAIHMLNWNGYDLDAPQEDIIDLAIGIVERTIDLAKSAEFFEAHAVRIDYPKLKEGQ